jgi:LacI family transcriptional regulator
MSATASQRLSAEAVFALLSKAKEEGTTTFTRAVALDAGHAHVGGARRLIGVAMNLDPWQMRLDPGFSQHHAFFDDVLFGIRARATVGGLDLLALTSLSGTTTGEKTRYAELCGQHGAVGIILVSFPPDEPELLEIVRSKLPCVAIDTHLFGPCAGFVMSDNVSGAMSAVRHLIELGRRRIAFIGGSTKDRPTADRLLGYESVLSEVGLGRSDELIVMAHWDHESAYSEMRRLLDRAERPDAVFCSSDGMAIGAMTAIEESGLRIPEDVAVVGFDDSEHARLVTPALTSVRQDLIGLGSAAVEAMLRILDKPDDPPPVSIMPVELVVRASSAGEPGLEQAPAKTADTGLEPDQAEPGELRARTVFEMLGKTDGPTETPATRPPGAGSQGSDRRVVAIAMAISAERDFRHAFFDDLFYSVRARASEEGIDLLVFTNYSGLEGTERIPFLELCRNHEAKGIILVSPPGESQILPLLESGFPCVSIDVDLLGPRVGIVMSDSVDAAARAVRHLAESGRRRIAFIGGRGPEQPSADRRLGYEGELSNLGLESREEWVAMGRWDHETAFARTREFLALSNRPDAIFCSSDVMAIGAMAAVEAAGLRVPDDVAVVGFDDIEYAQLITPSLTTMRQDRAGMAEAAVRAMLTILDQPSSAPPVVTFPVQLIVRGSTAGAGAASKNRARRSTVLPESRSAPSPPNRLSP